MRSVRLLCAAIMSAAALVAVGATTQSASAAGPLDVYFDYPNAVVGEQIQVAGRIPTPKIRTVKLQYRTGTSGAWTTKLTTKSDVQGYFSFTTKDTKTHYWRYTVPAGGGLPAIVGIPKRLPVVTQKVEYFAVTHDCDNDGHSIVTAWADFFPARAGRVVSFTTPEGTKTDYQDSRGIARVTVATTDTGLRPLQATALAFQGMAAKATTTKSVDLPNCPLA